MTTVLGFCFLVVFFFLTGGGHASVWLEYLGPRTRRCNSINNNVANQYTITEKPLCSV